MMALIANANRDRKKKATPFRPDDFNPFRIGRARRGGIPLTADTIGMLKPMAKG